MKYYSVNKLANKMPVILAPLMGTETITVLVMVKTGSKYESRKQSGLSHFLEHMFFKGTEKRPSAKALSIELDAVGGEYNAFTGKEYTGYYIKVASHKAEKALELVSDMLLNSKFESEEIEREKGVIVEEINMYEDNPLMKIEDVFESCLYGDTPAGWDTAGSVTNVQSFKRKDFVNYFKSQYGAKSSSLIIAGKMPKNINSLAKKYFSSLPINNWRDKVKVKDNQKNVNLKVVNKKTDQSTLSLGVRLGKISLKDEYVVKMLAIILGGSMSSRMFSEVRERRGLAYFVRTSTEFYSDSGYLTTTAGIKLGHEEEAVSVIINEYKNVIKESISEEELRRAKDMIKGRIAISLEASDDLANWYGHQTIYRQKYLSPNDFLNEIEKVSIKDLEKMAKKIFVDSNLNLALIGSVSVKLEKSLKNILSFK